jgi:hypothetical protein
VETLRAVVEVFVEAYNCFGKAKMMFWERYSTKEIPFSLLDFL